MARIAHGRWTHDHTGDLTVFLIGMRINRLWRPDAWLPVLAAMGPMLRELATDPDSGFLGYRMTLGWRGPVLVQYWRRAADLYRYATDRGARHRPAWTAFNRRARRVPGAVGVWHETYEVSRAESVYVDLPTVGLAAATAARPVTGRLDRAAARLAG
ncbi:DUF4188 domain-containing protein [Geodermatophilus sp. TF02-6]|uniref:DUF4188 domain-containing protein n=1 Tax=Geodermatophilus sp. TF02-6 TaxID=2250575 RepID=UPI000DE94F02|nr:DUF4188 domain-containing protein [Geodermatophilus sp. TF02-6]RBY74873.1 DUF4188 domain-containing protein [Geodermatophilus sp. TF02-6]